MVRPELVKLQAVERDTIVPIAKLDANESPLALSGDAAAQLGRRLAEVPLHRYGDDATAELRACIATKLNIAPDELCFGNGSNELIRLLAMVFARPRAGATHARILYPSPTFFGFGVAAQLAGAEPVPVPLCADMSLDLGAMDRAITQTRPNLVFLCRPNNPTGTLWTRSSVDELVLRHPDVLFAIDEVYHAYADSSLLDLVAQRPNVVVLRSLSKIGGAGLRVGYLVARREIAAQLDRVRPPFTVSAINAAGARWLLDDGAAHVEVGLAAVIAERQRLTDTLVAWGHWVYPSHANFILFRYEDGAAELWQRLQHRRILVSNFDRPGPLAGCLRVSVGRRDENDVFLDAIDAEMRSARTRSSAVPLTAS